MEKISWTDQVRNEGVLLRVNEQRNILHEIRKRKANWISHILRRNCLLQQVIELQIFHVLFNYALSHNKQPIKCTALADSKYDVFSVRCELNVM